MIKTRIDLQSIFSSQNWTLFQQSMKEIKDLSQSWLLLLHIRREIEDISK